MTWSVSQSRLSGARLKARSTNRIRRRKAAICSGVFWSWRNSQSSAIALSQRIEEGARNTCPRTLLRRLATQLSDVLLVKRRSNGTKARRNIIGNGRDIRIRIGIAESRHLSDAGGAGALRAG